MALKKIIILPNGIPIEYHRILEIKNIVNNETSIVIRSYVNQEQRNREKNHEIRYSDDIYTVQDKVNIPYNDQLDIVSAYKCLKTTPKYYGAEDVFESDEV